MLYRAFLAALLTASAYAQESPFTDIAATGDGSQVYIWSRLPLKTEPPLQNEMGLYKISDGSITRIATEREAIPAETRINFQASANGQTIVWSILRRCIGGSSCLGSPPPLSSRILQSGDAQPQALAGGSEISHNGRYLLRSGNGGTMLLQDRETGAAWTVPISDGTIGRTVTSDGRVLGLSTSAPDRLILWSSGRIDTVTDAPATPPQAAISDDGSVVVFQSADGNLIRLDPAQPSNRESLGPGTEPVLSNNGGLVLFRREAACLLSRRNQTGAESLLPTGTRAVACTLTNSGNAAFALTEAGQILRVDLTPTPTTKELIPATPYGFPGGALAPGTVLTWSGRTSVQFLLNGTPLPMIRQYPNSLWFQVPFDLPVNGGGQQLEIETASPFGYPARSLPVQQRAPYLLTDSGSLVASHGDFHGTVTAEDPARPGELIHLWAVGLGAVSPTATAGQPAPFSPLSTLASPFDCRVLRGESIPVLFAGLAPGLAGIYQVDIQLPNTQVDTGLFLSCGTPGVEAERHGGWLPARN